MIVIYKCKNCPQTFTESYPLSSEKGHFLQGRVIECPACGLHQLLHPPQPAEAIVVSINGTAERTPMTADDRAAALALAGCTFPAASFNKRFAADMGTIARSEAPDITENQRRNLWRLVWMYRRQIRDKALVELGRPVWEEWRRVEREARARGRLELETGKTLKDFWV